MYFIPPKPEKPSEILAGCVAVWRDAWSDPMRTIELLEQEITNNSDHIRWTKAKVGISTAEYKPNQRSNFNLSLTEAGENSEILRGLHNNIFEMIFSASQWYREHFGIDEVFIQEHFMALKYSTGEEFKGHYDGGSISKRVISPILYLNDNYEGGELEFVNYGLKIKPKAGDFYIFPASFAYRHIAHPVTQGTKYAVVTWLHDQAN